MVLPPGVLKITHLVLKDNVTLRLEAGCLLQASADSNDYSDRLPMVGAEDAHNIAICGAGRIDASGAAFYPDLREEVYTDTQGRRRRKALDIPGPLYIVGLINCRNVRIEGLHLSNTVSWTCMLEECEDVIVRGLTIRNPTNGERMNNDGIDIVACRRVLIEGCDIETGDDGVCLKTFRGRNSRLSPPLPVLSDIVVRDCTIASTCNATKIGTETAGEVRNVLFEGITVRKHRGVGNRKLSHDQPLQSGRSIAAISIQSNDGARVRNIVCRDYRIEECGAPFFILLQKRKKKITEGGPGSISGVRFQNIDCRFSELASQINVCEGSRVSDVRFENIRVVNSEEYSGAEMPPLPSGSYPDAQRYGPMPAYGLFARNVDGLVLKGDIDFTDAGDSGRPAIILQNVVRFRNGTTMNVVEKDE